MNNLKSFTEFKNALLEIKSDKDIVKDLARHLAFDKDVVKYLNTSRSKRELGWRDFLDTKLHGKNKDYITYLTKNMIADYNPQITGYIHINKEDEGDFDVEHEEENDRFDELPIDDKVAVLNNRISNVEDVLGIDPNDEDSVKKVEKELDRLGYEKPETDEHKDDEEEE